QGSYVYVVQEDTLQRRYIEIAWQNDEDAIISDGLANGDVLVTTPLGQVTSGVRVSIVNDESTTLATGLDTGRDQDTDRS
ncbi:MAG TPA: hypothetical protein VJ984_15805, partial [Xanthomonadales bacterium]|nr:hypothetical protein [Xanthomonadales bacterium]